MGIRSKHPCPAELGQTPSHALLRTVYAANMVLFHIFSCWLPFSFFLSPASSQRLPWVNDTRTRAKSLLLAAIGSAPRRSCARDGSSRLDCRVVIRVFDSKLRFSELFSTLCLSLLKSNCCTIDGRTKLFCNGRTKDSLSSAKHVRAQRQRRPG